MNKRINDILIMMKKMYKQPATDILTVNTERMMDQITVSPGAVTDPNSPPSPNAPKRGELID